MRILAGGRGVHRTAPKPRIRLCPRLCQSPSRFCFACLMELSGAGKFKPN